MTTTEVTKAMKSATGAAYRMPSIPKKRGRISSSGTRKNTCRVRESKILRTGFPMAAKKIGGKELDTVDHYHQQIAAHEPVSKFKVKLVAGTEKRNTLPGENLKGGKPHRRDRQTDPDCQAVCTPNPGILPRAIVEANDGLGPLRDAHNHAGENRIDLDHNAAGGQRDFAAVDGKHPIIFQRVVQHNLNHRHSQLIKAVAQPQGGDPSPLIPANTKVCRREPDAPEPFEVGQAHHTGGGLAQHRGPGRARPPPICRQR